MKVLFVHDTYYAQSPANDVHSYGAFPYQLWEERFLTHFDQVCVVGRKKDYEAAACLDLPLSNGPRVDFRLLDNINTPLKRLFGAQKVAEQIRRLVAAHDLVVIRGPVEFGMIAARAARDLHIPYVVEMSGCAFDHTYYHGSAIGKLYAPIKFRRAQKMLRFADAVIYVTQHFLQKRYPTRGHMACASNVDIVAVDFSVLEKRLAKIESYHLPLKIGLIGNYGNHLKGLAVALAALGRIKDNCPPFMLHVLGSGNPALWTDDIERAGLHGRVFFDAALPAGEPVYQWLDNMDFYLQPSFHEGLPRALIEALSRGLPALASDAGGSDELLPKENIHERGNVKQLADRLERVITDKIWLKEQAHLNFDTAKLYSRDVLLPIRYQFWADVKKLVSSRRSF